MSSSSGRLKREECSRTKHDTVFSKWEILIGPSDWEDHSLGKYGVERYRIHNLPVGSSCPGIYELGIAAIPTNGIHRTRKHGSENIVVVYLGQADNIRTRLQHYGRAGSHLDSGKKSESLCPQRGPGLFKEIFSRGYSIMFRWAPMSSKKEAEMTEAQLLAIFDYAWNRSRNGAARREDILVKIDSAVTSPVHTILRKLQRWKLLIKEVGIKIDAGFPVDEPERSIDKKGFRLPRVLKFAKSQPHFVQGGEGLRTDHDICGVAIGGGSICRSKPVIGRKRCEKHKGKRISGTHAATGREVTATQGNLPVCGVALEDGSLCVEFPVHGRKRCQLHKGRRISGTHAATARQVTATQGNLPLCGVALEDGSLCVEFPVHGRKRCQLHKGRRVAETRPLKASNIVLSDQIDVAFQECQPQFKVDFNIDEEHVTCGVPSAATAREVAATQGNSSLCGIVLEDGSLCVEFPVHGRKRCQLHKGRRVAKTKPLKSSNIVLDQIDIVFQKCQPQFKVDFNINEDYVTCV